MRSFVSRVCVLLLTPVILTPSSAEACKCRPAPPPKEAAAAADAVLSGKVTSIEAAGDNQLKVTIEVATSFKGDAAKTAAIYTANDGAACGYHFEKGKNYLIYARLSGEGADQLLRTGLCTRTRPIADADEDLKELGAGTKPK